MNELTIVIPFYNGHQYVDQTLAGIPDEIPVIVVDDCSDQPLSLTRLQTTVLRLEAKGYFSGAVNAGIRACETDVLVLNQDIRLNGRQWLETIAEHQDHYALIGDGVFGHPAWPDGYVQGTFMYMRRDAIERIGVLDAETYPLWGATCEWQLRLCRNGFEALPLTNVPGFFHERGDKPFGHSIQQVLDAEPEKKPLFVQTPPKVSVVISCFNYGRYLTDAVNSLIGGDTSLGHMPGQTFQAFEVIIVNDASTDDTAEIAQGLADDWKGIRYIELPPSNHPDGLPNNGTPAANNAGIEAAYGKYISILCADDMMEPRRLERMLALQEQNPHSMIYDDMMYFGNGRRTKGRRMEDYDFELLLKQNHVHAGILFPRQAWEEVGGYPEAMRYGREDWAFNVALGIHGYCGVRLEEPGYLYRREKQGRSYRNTNPQWRDRFMEQMMNLFPRIYAGDRPMSCCGSRRVTAPASTRGAYAMTQANLVGSRDGMKMVEYLGANLGTQEWASPVTGARYVFGGKRKRGWVDERDIEWITSKWQGDRPLFRVVEETEGAAELKVSNKEAETVQVGEGVGETVIAVKKPAGDADVIETPGEPETAMPETPAEEPDAVAPKDPKTLSVKKLEKYLEDTDLTQAELNAMLALEKAGSPRSTAVDALLKAGAEE